MVLLVKPMYARIYGGRLGIDGLLVPDPRHCVVSLSKALYPLLSTGSTQEDKDNVPT